MTGRAGGPLAAASAVPGAGFASRGIVKRPVFVPLRPELVRVREGPAQRRSLGPLPTALRENTIDSWNQMQRGFFRKP